MAIAWRNQVVFFYKSLVAFDGNFLCVVRPAPTFFFTIEQNSPLLSLCMYNNIFVWTDSVWIIWKQEKLSTCEKYSRQLPIFAGVDVPKNPPLGQTMQCSKKLQQTLRATAQQQ